MILPNPDLDHLGPNLPLGDVVQDLLFSTALTRGNALEHADFTAPTRERNELQKIKRTDHDSICTERSRS